MCCLLFGDDGFFIHLVVGCGHIALFSRGTILDHARQV
jgi:hypothetical protein